jgi:RNA polymerase sigma factor (sigma-70 family)
MIAVVIILSLFCKIASLALQPKDLYLTPKQMYSSRGILLNPASTPAQRLSVQNILYRSHENWAEGLARKFKQFHRYKCRDIQTQDLVLAGKMGLYRSSRNYNGQTTFSKYAELYVKSELFRTMTRHISMSASEQTFEPIKSDGISPLDKLMDQETYMDIWRQIDEFGDPFLTRIFWLKYDSEFNVIRKNKHVAELMCCSEETIRQQLKKGVHIISENDIE